jgi:cytidine deaminase
MTGTERQTLIDAACRAREQAYAPYSHFRVGAALLATDGRVFTGVNVENASYGLTVCAERNAAGRMVGEGARHIAAVAVCTDNGVTPCGACRQVLAEFAPTDGEMILILIDGRGTVRDTTLAALLPDQFGPEHLR